MKYKKLGSSNLKISVVGMGCWAIGGRKWGIVNDEDSIKAIKEATKLGINFFDTADVYGFGHSEELLGKTLKSSSNAVIATKVGLRWNSKGKLRHDLSPKYIKEACEASLKRLNKGAIDLYQIHWPDNNTPFEETLNALDSLVKEGKVRYVGACNLKLDLLQQISQYSWFVSYQDAYSLFNKKAKEALLPYCKQKNISFIAYEPLFKGMLTGKFSEKPSFEKGDHRKYEERFTDKFSYYKEKTDFLAEIARKYGLSLTRMSLALLLMDDGITTVIPGAKNAFQVKQNALAADISKNLLKVIKSEVDVIYFFEELSRAGLKLGINWKRQFTELISEIAIGQNLSCRDVFNSPEIQNVVNHPKLSGPQKIAKIKDILIIKRYPAYTKAKSAFEKQLKELKLHPKIKVTATPYFEDNNLVIKVNGYPKPILLKHTLKQCKSEAKLVKASGLDKEINESLKKLKGVDLVENAIKSVENIS